MKKYKRKGNKYGEVNQQDAQEIIKYYKNFQKNQPQKKSTCFDIALLVLVILIVYFIIYKLIVIFIEIKIVNQNTDFVRESKQLTSSSLKKNEYSFIRQGDDLSLKNQNNQDKTKQTSTSQFYKQYYNPQLQQKYNQNPQDIKNDKTITDIIKHQMTLQNINEMLESKQIQKQKVQKLEKQKIELLQKIRLNLLKQEKIKQSQIHIDSKNQNSIIDQQKNKLVKDSFQQTSTNQNKQSNKYSSSTSSGKREDLSKYSSLPAKPLGFQVNKAGISPEQIKQAMRFVQLKNKPKNDPMADQQRKYYQQKYNLTKYQKQLPICVVIPSFNNVQGNRYIGNIDSILQQEYKNYHIIFIDDASTDNTSEKLKQYLKNKDLPENKIKFIKNQKQMFAMYNLRRAALQFCKSEDIYMIVDGDDQLLGRQVFRLYNTIFQQRKAYFVYSNFITTLGNLGYSRMIPMEIKVDNKYRKHTYVTSHLRAFYTKLFQLIKQQDLRDNFGSYFKAANDIAICMPILQMSHEKVEYVPEITYHYNGATGLNNHKIRLDQQKKNNKTIRKRKKYFPIIDLFGQQKKQTITN